MFVSTVFWKSNRNRFFTCVYRFDHIVSWVANVSPNTCEDGDEFCSVKSIYLEKVQQSLEFNRFLRVILVCNGTAIRASFLLNTVVVDRYTRHMMSQYAVFRDNQFVCFSLIRWRKTDVLALSKPFKLEVWILTFLTSLVIARLASWLGFDSFRSLVVRSLLSFISVAEMGAHIRRYSHLFFIGSALALSFFVGHIYENSVMSFFLDPRSYESCTPSIDCRLQVNCYSRRVVRFYLTTSSCACNLNQEQQSLAGKPLRREIFTNVDIFDLVTPKSRAYLQKDMTDLAFSKLWASKGQLLLILARTSSLVDRWFQTGVVSTAHLKPTRVDIEGFFSKPAIKIIQSRMSLKEGKWDEFMEFNATGGKFDMESFLKVQLIVRICVITSFSVFFCELLVLIRNGISSIRSGLCLISSVFKVHTPNYGFGTTRGRESRQIRGAWGAYDASTTE